MLAGAHRVLRIVTGRQRVSEQAGTLGELPGMRRRRAWAQSVHQTLNAVGHCCSPWWQLPHDRLGLPAAHAPRGRLDLSACAAGSRGGTR
jgi:hypothetical protein